MEGQGELRPCHKLRPPASSVHGICTAASQHGSSNANTGRASLKGSPRGAVPAHCPPAPGCGRSPGEDLSFCTEHCPPSDLGCALKKSLHVFPFLTDEHGTKTKPHPATGTKPPATSWQHRQVKQALGALNKQSGLREWITDISGSKERPLEPQLLSRSDWLPPRTLMGKGRAMMLSLRWVRARETDKAKEKHSSNTSQTPRLEKPVSPAFPFPFFLVLLLF